MIINVNYIVYETHSPYIVTLRGASISMCSGWHSPTCRAQHSACGSPRGRLCPFFNGFLSMLPERLWQPLLHHVRRVVVRKKGVLAHMTIVVIESSPTPNFPVIKITPFLQMSIYLPFPIPIPPIDATRHTFQNFQ